MIAQAVTGSSTVSAQLGHRVVTVHVAHTEQIVLGISGHVIEVHKLDEQLLGLQGRDLVQLVQSEEEVGLQIAEAPLIRGPVAEEVRLDIDPALDDQPTIIFAVHLEGFLADLDLLDTALLGVQGLAGGIGFCKRLNLLNLCTGRIDQGQRENG